MPKTQYNKNLDCIELVNCLVVSFTVDDIAEASMEAKHMLYYNPEAVLNARADYAALSDTTKHVLACLVAGQDVEAAGMSCSGRGRKKNCYINNIKRYIKHIAQTVNVSGIFDEAKGFINSLDSEQLDNIYKIIV